MARWGWLCLPLFMVVIAIRLGPDRRTPGALLQEACPEPAHEPPTVLAAPGPTANVATPGPLRTTAADPAVVPPSSGPEEGTPPRSGDPDPGLLRVRVQSREGTPLSCPTIQVLPARHVGTRPNRIEHADTTGILELPLEAGRWLVAAWTDDSVSSVVEVSVRPGRTTRVELRTSPATPFEGRVVDALTGVPVAGATVSVWTHAEADAVRTGADGVFVHPRFPRLGKAQQIQARASGYGPAIRYLAVDSKGRWKVPSSPGGLEARRGTGTPWIEIELVPEIRPFGRVLDSEGRPLAGVRVIGSGYVRILPGVASPDSTSSVTDAEGRFELIGLRSDIGHDLAFLAADRASRNLRLEAGLSGPVDIGDVRLAPGEAVRGLVVDPEGRPVADALVRVRLSREHAASPASAPLEVTAPVPPAERRVRTDEEGRFELTGLAPEAQVLTVERDAGPLSTRELFPGTPEALDLVLQLPPQTLALEGNLPPAALEGEDARIELRRNGIVARVRPNPDGSFRIAGLDGEAPYELRARWIAPDGLEKAVQGRFWAFERPAWPPGLPERALARAPFK